MRSSFPSIEIYIGGHWQMKSCSASPKQGWGSSASVLLGPQHVCFAILFLVSIFGGMRRLIETMLDQRNFLELI